MNYSFLIGQQEILPYKTLSKKIGETTILVPQVYPVCAVDPSSVNQAQLVSQILKLSCISPFTNFC